MPVAKLLELLFSSLSQAQKLIHNKLNTIILHFIRSAISSFHIKRTREVAVYDNLSCSHIDNLYHLILIPKIIALLSLVAPSVVNLIVVEAVIPVIVYS